MITSTYGLTATERVLPRLALDFTTAVADPRVGTARAANTATRFNQNGLIEIVNANLPRFDFSPTALTCQGQLIEETRANLFLNSLIDGTNLSTQSVTLSAVAYTLSFYGSGSVAISGGHSATVSGVGDFPNRKNYTFTPTAGSSTFTVSGDVKFAQLEAGAFPTSYIPTTTTSVTRNADVVSMTGTNFSSWYNASEGAFMVEFTTLPVVGSGKYAYGVSDGSTSNFIGQRQDSARVQTLGSTVAAMNSATAAGNTTYKSVIAYKQDDFAANVNAAALYTDNTGALPAVDQFMIGDLEPSTNRRINCWARKVLYWPQRLINAEVTTFSK
jgi:hypothetical protein